MTTMDTHVPSAEDTLGPGFACLADWVTTTDHKKIGRLYLGAGALTALASLVIAGLLAAERIDIDRELLGGGSLTQLFTLQRFGLLYLTLAPIVVGVAVAVVPLQVGARSTAFPRLAAAGFWAWLVGAGLAVYAVIMNGGPGGGEPRFVDLFILATMLTMAGLLASIGSVAVTVLTTRAPGMNLRRLPYLAWSSLVMALALVVAVPALLGLLLYLYVGHHYPSLADFSGNQAFGGVVGFGFSQPFTVVFLLPVLGFVADAVATATHRKVGPRGPIMIGMGLLGLGFVSVVVQGAPGLRTGFRHLDFFWDKIQELIPFGIAYCLPALGALLVVGPALQSLRRKPSVQPGLAFAVPAALLALLGATAAILSGIGDAALGGTVYEEGTMGAIVAAGILGGAGALLHWLPKFNGRTVSGAKVAPLALVGLLGGVLVSVPMMIAGFADQPGGIFPTVAGDSEIVNFQGVSGPVALWNSLALVGFALLALVVLGTLALALFGGAKDAGDDPYDGLTLEWATTSPAPRHNFDAIHIVRSAEPLADLKISNRSDA